MQMLVFRVVELLKDFLFLPSDFFFGEMIQFAEHYPHIFQMGLFNH